MEIDELTPVAALCHSPAQTGFAAGCRALFAGADRLLRLGESVVAFRNEDLRQLAARAELGQTPPSVLNERAFRAPDGRGGTLFAAALARMIANQFFSTNPPIHKPLRQVFAPHFMPKSVMQLEPLAVRMFEDLLRELPRDVELDLCSTIAGQFTARFFGSLVGLSPPEQQRVVQLMHGLTPMFFMDKSALELAAADAAAAEYIELIVAAVRRAEAAGTHSVVSVMASELAKLSFDDDPTRAGIVPESIGLMMAGNLLDGFHTAAVLASNTIALILQHPEVLPALRSEPLTVRGAVYESLRMLAPLTVTQRYALEEFDYAGVHVPSGSQVVMLWAVGNRDPQVFDNPDTFDPHRSRRGETTFGGGVHLCPGRYVAIMLAETLVRALCAGELAVHAESATFSWRQRSILCQLSALPVRLRRHGATPPWI